MGLARMQDIGGCRAVVKAIDHVDKLEAVYQKSRVRHTLVKCDDYIREDPGPKESGYRGLHLVYRYSSDRTPTWNGLQIEVQIRSRLQHAWATAVETVGTFSSQALKSSQGAEDWLRFFALMGSAIALKENTPMVPGTPSTLAELRSELRDCVDSLNVITRLEAYGHTLRRLGRAVADKRARYFLLKLNAQEATPTLNIRPFQKREIGQAAEEYQAIERANVDSPDVDAVLVSVESVNALRRAYPNYFLDTKEFRRLVEEAIGP
jgi:hypothetical protein